jgi:hypothetical protein
MRPEDSRRWTFAMTLQRTRSPFSVLTTFSAVLLFSKMLLPASATLLHVRFLNRQSRSDDSSQQRGTPHSIRGGHRWLQNVPTLTTSTCDTIRTTSFLARLDLNYYYMVETVVAHGDVSGIEDAIRYAIVGALDSCDAQGRPAFEISLESAHGIATDGKTMRVERFFCKSGHSTDQDCAIIDEKDSASPSRTPLHASLYMV